jgi:LysR family nitrogen assimilation transcriptional regulator
MRLRQLVCFVRVCELGSISRAAEELHIAQPALGLQIRGLEHEFGTDLVVRSSKGVAPTRAGELVLEHSRALIQQDRELRARLKQLHRDGPEHFTLALTASLVHLIAGAVIERVHARFPDTRLELMEGASELIADWVQEERAQLGLGFGNFPMRGVEGVPLLKERLYYLSSAEESVPAGEPSDTITLSEVLSRPLALPNEQSSIRHIVEAAARTLDIPVIGAYEIASLDANRAIARRGIAGTIVPFGGIADDVARGELRARMIVEPKLERKLYVWRRKDHPTSAGEKELMEIVTSELRQAMRNKAPPGTYIFLDEK